MTTTSDYEHPGLWLLALTHYGFLPVDWCRGDIDPKIEEPYRCEAADPPQRKDKSTNWFSSNPVSLLPPGQVLQDRFPLDQPSRGWFTVALGMGLAILAGCCLLVKNNYSAEATWLTVDGGYGMRLPALLGACLSLSALQWILALPEALVLWKGHDWSWFSRAVIILIAVAMLAPLVAFFEVLRKAKSRDSFKWRPLRGRALGYAAAMIGVFAWIAYNWWTICGDVRGATEPSVLLFRLRAGLFMAPSPALPLFLLSLVFSIGFLLYFYRYTDAAMLNPRLQPDQQPPVDAGTKPLMNAIDRYAQAPFELPPAVLGRRLGICMSLTAVAMLSLWYGMRAFERWEYNCALYTAMAMLLIALATASYDLVVVWSNLKSFLTRLESEDYDLKDAFERVTKSWPRRAIFAFWHYPTGDPSGDVTARRYCRYIIYAVRQTQRMAWGVMLCLLTLIAVLTAYSPQSPQLVGRFVATLFLVVGGIVIWVFVGMERNWTLSRIARTEPGELNVEFWLQAGTVILVPLFGVLVHLFPSIGSFFSSFVAPSLEALRWTGY